jgi:hypothetical protein
LAIDASRNGAPGASKGDAMKSGTAQPNVDRGGDRQKDDSLFWQIVPAAIAIAIGGALAAIELAIFRHGAGSKFGLLATGVLVVGVVIVAMIAIGFVRRENERAAKAWTMFLGGALVYFLFASVVADWFYTRGAFALGAPRTVTAQRQVDAAKARLDRLAGERGVNGYTEDQRWAIAVNQSLIKAGETDLAYAKAVPESEQIYPQYPTGDEVGGYADHVKWLVDQAKERRAKQGYPVSEPLPGYLKAPSLLESRIARAKSLAAGAEAQVPLCKSGRAAGYPRISTPVDVKGCEEDWHNQALRHMDNVARDQRQLDFEREAFANIPK